MTSTPMYHPEDQPRPHPEDQGEDTSSTSNDGGDLVDEETKQLSQEEAEQHDGIVDAQKDEIDADGSQKDQGGGYGH
ncbi:hypothetical protein [uncultured Brachybacterium sp.]|uniref:hypothetical protein n=1 Tax=uncultured Brachybacterium sp. TaxID=189680 RepID=UPI00261E592A|nr:hypothetical protein [uncultured Brachybacterium sp.]